MVRIRAAATVAFAVVCSANGALGVSLQMEDAKVREMARRAISGGNTIGDLSEPDPKDIIEDTQGDCTVANQQTYDYFVYSGLSDGTNWNDAKSFCTNPDGFDGDLVSISCNRELNFVHDLVQRYGGKAFWLGGSRCEGKNKCARTKPKNLAQSRDHTYYDEAW